MRVELSDEVASALAEGRPVVALESTILCHGLPFPSSLETHAAAEAAVRREGAVPALVAVVDGVPRAGFPPDGAEALARAGRAVRKATTRDLGLLAARRESGATTVAATMAIAAAAGIRVFATGGIGGVHRGAEETFDVSADLLELGRTRVAVVAAGAKAVLDLPKTLEALETLGVPVLGFGTSELPAFWVRGSGLPLDVRCDDPEAVAAILRAHWAWPAAGGVLVANPVPAEAALPGEAVDGAIERSLEAARAAGVSGKEVTPFLLARLAEETGGRTLAANRALVVSNASVAARVAAALARG
ncbi:MAG: pseudouridine-5'-phosphate glycosidase [Thermoanaerobaculia bacterium]